jgi:bifunctional non-homologous end joining protein LigD
VPDLEDYRRKRDFGATPEPEPVERTGPAGARPRFVIQRHDARSLHFDLRLEHEGVLLSWAVPKGVPLRTAVKRLAVQTEPHPLEYLDFAGVIPEGEYGAGRMTVWDAGEYDLVGRAAGEWKVRLDGGLLRGEYHLVRTGAGDSDQWLLFRSAQGGEGPPDPRPRFRELRPMQPTLVERPFDDPEWSFEVKWDGYRALVLISPDGDEIRSRSGQDLSEEFDFGDLRRSVFMQEAVLDAEIVVLDARGRADFGALQRRQGRPTLMAFDLLYADGLWLLDEAWAVRRELLGRVLTPEAPPQVRMSDDMPGRGTALFEAAAAQGIEGIVAKRHDSPYRPGARTDAWRKVKVRRVGDFVIGGFTLGEGSRRHTLGAVIVGEHEDDGLVHRGQVGSGIGDEAAGALRARLDPLVLDGSPFEGEVAVDGETRWVEPVLRCRVSYAELTDEGRLRAPVFEQLVVERGDGSVDERVVTDGARRVRLTNLSKPFWPDDGLTKGDLVDHYAAVAEVIVPHLSDRAMILKRYPDGIAGEAFFQHNVPAGAPDWLRTAELARSDDPGRATNTYAVVDDPLALLWVANLGCVDMNPWQSRVDTPDQPTHVLFDLDPMEGVGFARVAEVALLVRSELEDLGLCGYPKTSGGAGMHVFVPVAPGPSYEVARLFALAVARRLAAARPDLVTTEVPKAKRGPRVCIDSNQNGRGRSISSVYSLRPRPGAPVATPLRWDEVGDHLAPERFTTAEVVRRIGAHGDLFAPVLDDAQDLAAAVHRLSG